MLTAIILLSYLIVAYVVVHNYQLRMMQAKYETRIGNLLYEIDNLKDEIKLLKKDQP